MSSKLESDVCCRLQVAPSAESYEGKRRPGRKQWQTTARYMALFTSRHLRADCCTPGSAPGPTLGNDRVWENFTFFIPPIKCVVNNKLLRCCDVCMVVCYVDADKEDLPEVLNLNSCRV